MMDWTDRHDRFFLRLLSKHAVLYTEMVTTGALIHGDQKRHLDYNQEEHPVALQLGGSSPEDLATSAKLADQWGYDEINLNVGCPSDRVQNGSFGACLMAEPQLVRDCMSAIRNTTDVPATVKHRIGIDDTDSYESMRDFVCTVAESGVDIFIVHARKAILKGLSPKENREIPPLQYDKVYRLKEEHPELKIIINGGITAIDECSQHLEKVDGVMVGRSAYQTPFVLAEVDRAFYDPKAAIPTRKEVLQEYIEYAEAQMTQGAYLGALTRHTLGLFQGERGAKAYRRYISENAHKKGNGPEIMQIAMDLVDCA